MKANTKKNSTTKKLVPAAGSLLISAAMLGTSTYAWFTMSREVEVQNIQMTATVPEDIQISLGRISDAGGENAAQSTTNTLAENGGYLTFDSSNGQIIDPGTEAENWSNTADISNYYAFGKLIPASSTTGENIFFTPDANGVGKTVDPNGKFYTAALANQAQTEDKSGATTKYNATAFTYRDGNTKNSSGTWQGYSEATAWNVTQDDGYYVDIPVWLRTSSTQGAALTVKAYVKDAANTDASNPLAKTNTASSDGKLLYKAVRVAVLDGTTGTQLGSGSKMGMLPVADSKYGSGTVLDWYQRTANTSGAGVKTNENNKMAIASVASNVATYGTVTPYDGNTAFINLSAGSGTGYGTASKYIIRVWLEGEDPDCWNETAGQDWSINLKFENSTTK